MGIFARFFVSKKNAAHIGTGTRKDVDAIFESGLPLQEQENRLSKLISDNKYIDLEYAYTAYQSVMGTMVDRNVNGLELERQDKCDEAVVLYEQNLRDRFIGSHPYERLRIYYSSRDLYHDAIRVCQAYIDHGQNGDEGKAKCAHWIRKYHEKIGGKT